MVFQAFNSVKHIFKFHMYPFIFKTAIDVIKSVIFVGIIPTLGFDNDKVDFVIAESDLLKGSEINRRFFLFKLLYFFL